MAVDDFEQRVKDWFSSKKVRAFWVSALFLAAFFYVFYIFNSTGMSSPFATIMANLFVAVLGFSYMSTTKLHPHMMSFRSVGLANYFLMLGVLLMIWFFSQITSQWVVVNIDFNTYSMYQQLAESDMMMYMILTCVFAPIGEEILMRGIVFRVFYKAGYKLWFACLMSVLIFAAAHGTVVHLVMGLFIGLFFCFVYYYTGNIFVSILAHMIYNTICVFAGAMYVPGVFLNPVVFFGVDVLLIVFIFVWFKHVYDLKHRQPTSLSDVYSMECRKSDID